jgi:hypothetical protein
MAVMLNKRPPKYTPQAVKALGQRGTAMARAYKPPPPPKPVLSKTPLPGARNWGQAAEYGWTGSPDPGVVTRATNNQYLSPYASAPMFGGGQQPSYGGMIGGDWEVQDAEAAMAARMASLRGDFTSGIRQALIDLGVTDTSKLGGFGQYIDAETISKAAQNKYSQSAQVAAAEKRQQRQSRAALAARGILSSGQTTKSEGDIAATAETARYNALRDFLQQGQSGLRGIADEEYALSRGVAQARQAAAMRAAETYWGGMGGGEYGGDYQAQDLGMVQMPQVKAPVRAPVRAPARQQSAYERALMARSQALNRRYGLGRR